MKFSVKPKILIYLVLGSGVLGLALRYLLYATGTDSQGLLAASHFARYLIWILTAVTLAGLFLLTRQISGPELYRDCFPASTPAGIGGILAAIGVLLTTITEASAGTGAAEMACTVLGYVAALVLLFVGVCRLCGMQPGFLFHAVLSIYFALRMVAQYRHWSSDPQLMDYCFHLCACVGLMLTSYHHAAFGAELASHKRLWFFSLATVYLCCLALAGPENQLFYLTCGIWLFTNLSSLEAKPRRQRPSLNLDTEPGPQEG